MKDLAPTTRRRIAGKGPAGALSAVALKNLTFVRGIKGNGPTEKQDLVYEWVTPDLPGNEGMFDADGPDDPMTKSQRGTPAPTFAKGCRAYERTSEECRAVPSSSPWPLRTSPTSVTSTAFTLDEWRSTSSCTLDLQRFVCGWRIC